MVLRKSFWAKTMSDGGLTSLLCESDWFCKSVSSKGLFDEKHAEQALEEVVAQRTKVVVT